MSFPVHIDTKRMGMFSVYFKGSQLYVTEGCFNHSKCVDPDEMQLYAAFHLGLHSLPKYPFRGWLSIGLARDIFVFIAYVQNTHLDAHVVSIGGSLNFGLSLHLHIYFVYASSKSSGDSAAHLRFLA